MLTCLFLNLLALFFCSSSNSLISIFTSSKFLHFFVGLLVHILIDLFEVGTWEAWSMRGVGGEKMLSYPLICTPFNWSQEDDHADDT